MLTLFLLATMIKSMLDASVVRQAGMSSFEIITLIFTGVLLLVEIIGLWLSHRKHKHRKNHRRNSK